MTRVQIIRKQIVDRLSFLMNRRFCLDRDATRSSHVFPPTRSRESRNPFDLFHFASYYLQTRSLSGRAHDTFIKLYLVQKSDAPPSSAGRSDPRINFYKESRQIYISRASSKSHDLIKNMVFIFGGGSRNRSIPFHPFGERHRRSSRRRFRCM